VTSAGFALRTRRLLPFDPEPRPVRSHRD
jgi:hypothetical protein